MLMLESNEYPQGNSKDLYQASPALGPSPGFLTPATPYEFDGRRDSIVSAQSSMSMGSFSSYASDGSIPVTPTGVRSPLANNGFSDSVHYDMNFHVHGHGLPLDTHAKEPSTADSIYGGWTMISEPNPAEAQPIPFRLQDGFSATGPFTSNFQPQIVQTDFDGSIAGAESLWSTHASFGDGSRHLVNPFIERTSMSEDMRTFWANDIQSSEQAPAQTMTPSDVMLGVHDDYAAMQPDAFESAHAFDVVTPSFPQSPVGISLSRKACVSVKRKHNSDDCDGRLKRLIYESPTGGKSVKQERRPGKKSNRKKKGETPEPADVVLLNGCVVELKYTDCERDELTGKVMSTTPRPQPHLCEVRLPGGRKCGRAFKRPEHKKRHEITHLGITPFSCEICLRPFGRNDNCQEHYWTHVQKPGSKAGRNEKYSLAEVEERIMHRVKGPKLIEKLRFKWSKL
ncbi:hypothetical protein BDV95DRAFT_604359 [Massariosphaeria phaeospora]|uniref:C2H2-type domain-containing protein n=1 Tax=Massariosphaeria phaeospora TaxID=100035 RepID=A0A7C8M924_9PLEO|nr:hypothetical protein BDV95DRAFT_604359 [Massariosphaeria phaeospora]